MTGSKQGLLSLLNNFCFKSTLKNINEEGIFFNHHIVWSLDSIGAGIIALNRVHQSNQH